MPKGKLVKAGYFWYCDKTRCSFISRIARDRGTWEAEVCVVGTFGGAGAVICSTFLRTPFRNRYRYFVSRQLPSHRALTRRPYGINCPDQSWQSVVTRSYNPNNAHSSRIALLNEISAHEPTATLDFIGNTKCKPVGAGNEKKRRTGLTTSSRYFCWTQAETGLRASDFIVKHQCRNQPPRVLGRKAHLDDREHACRARGQRRAVIFRTAMCSAMFVIGEMVCFCGWRLC